MILFFFFFLPTSSFYSFSLTGLQLYGIMCVYVSIYLHRTINLPTVQLSCCCWQTFNLVCIPGKVGILHNSEIESLKVGIPQMSTDPWFTEITCWIPELHCAWSWHVAHCWNFTLFPQLLCDTFNNSSCYLIVLGGWGGEPSFFWQLWSWAQVLLKKGRKSLNHIVLVFCCFGIAALLIET